MEEENPETELRRLFDSYDSDGSGELSKAEVAAALEDLNLPLTYVEQIFGLIDANQDGSLSFEEFQSYVAATEQELRDLFDLIDVDRSGGITYDELLSSLTQMRLAPDPQRVKQMMAKMDADSSGEISFSHFKHIFSLLPPLHPPPPPLRPPPPRLHARSPRRPRQVPAAPSFPGQRRQPHYGGPVG